MFVCWTKMSRYATILCQTLISIYVIMSRCKVRSLSSRTHSTSWRSIKSEHTPKFFSKSLKLLTEGHVRYTSHEEGSGESSRKVEYVYISTWQNRRLFKWNWIAVMNKLLRNIEINQNMSNLKYFFYHRSSDVRWLSIFHWCRTCVNMIVRGVCEWW